MPTVQLVDDSKVKASCRPVKVLQQEVTKVYFATKEEVETFELDPNGSDEQVSDHITTSAQTLPKIAEIYGVPESQLERTKTGEWLFIDEVIKVTKKGNKLKTVSFTEITTANMNDEVYIIVETKHLENEKVKINILQGGEDGMVKLNKELTVQVDDEDKTLIETTVGALSNEEDISNKDDFADWGIVKVKLAPKDKDKIKEWKDGLDCISTGKAQVYLLVDLHSDHSMENFESKYIKYKGCIGAADDSKTPNHFLNEKGNYFEIAKVEWHDPVDDPICTLYMQSGGSGELGKHWGLFGKTRNGSKHSGLDLFATTGTDIFACVDGTIYNRRWHGGYGNTVTIKVTDTEAFKQLKREYTLQYSTAGEIKEGASWSDSGDIFLFYAHLDSVNDYAFGDEVKCGDVLGTTGRSGVTAGTMAPHLHFEILCDYTTGVGTKYRINPAYWVDYKGFAEQSDAEKESQKTEKELGKTKEVNGVEKLTYAHMTDFVK